METSPVPQQPQEPEVPGYSFAEDSLAEDGPTPKPWWFHGLIGFWVAFIVAAQLPSVKTAITLSIVGIVAVSVTAATYGATVGGTLTDPGSINTRSFAALVIGAVLVGVVAKRLIVEADMTMALMAIPIGVMFAIATGFSWKHHNGEKLDPA